MKEFYSYEQQVAKLKETGLLIDDEDMVINHLKYEGYYNIINGYSCMFKSSARYYSGTTFENILSLYNFDRNLQSIVYKYALTIECHIKALIAHEFSKEHGVDEVEYLKASCFNPNPKFSDYVNELIETCNKVIAEGIDKKNNRYRPYIAHNSEKHGHVPLWILVRALTFGTISKFYRLMLPEEKRVIADNYGVTEIELTNMLNMLVQFRNIVAHGERVYCAKLDKNRLGTSLGVIKNMSIPLNEYKAPKYGQKDFLSLMIIFRYLLPDIKFAGFQYEVNVEIESLEKSISPNVMGKIKKEMGLNIGSWKVLHKIKK